MVQRALGVQRRRCERGTAEGVEYYRPIINSRKYGQKKVPDYRDPIGERNVELNGEYGWTRMTYDSSNGETEDQTCGYLGR